MAALTAASSPTMLRSIDPPARRAACTPHALRWGDLRSLVGENGQTSDVRSPAHSLLFALIRAGCLALNWWSGRGRTADLSLFTESDALQTTLPPVEARVANVLAFRGPDPGQTANSDGSPARGTSYLRGGCPSLAVAGLGLVQITVGALTDHNDWARPVARRGLGDLQLGLLSGLILAAARWKAGTSIPLGITMGCGRRNRLAERIGVIQ